MIIDPSEQGSEAWLTARAGVVTASNLNKVMSKGRGSAPSKTRLGYMHKLAHEILTGRYISEGFKSDYMRRGNDLEDQARANYELVTGEIIETVGLIYLNESKRIGASLDGLVNADGETEIKCPAIHTHSGYLLGCLAEGNLPPEYVKQIQGQLWIAELDWCDFISYHPEAFVPYKSIRVNRDDEMIDAIKAAVGLFINDLDALVEQIKTIGLKKAA